LGSKDFDVVEEADEDIKDLFDSSEHE
jgi:hypothetical protein